MTSIPQNLRYWPHTLETRYHAVKTYRGGTSVAVICRQYKVSKASLMRWNKQYDATKESLKDKSHRPHKTHPTAHTQQELTWIKTVKETKQVHPLDLLCQELGIEHKLIRPRTPRHNGKVGRSHRNDNRRFYQNLRFYSYDDLIMQMKRYLYTSNRLLMQTLGWKSPIDIRKSIEELAPL